MLACLFCLFLLVAGLSWAYPGWLGNGTSDPFASPQQTSTYLTNWVAGAKSAYNLDIDYLGLWNEKPTTTPLSIAFVPILRATLDAAGFSNVSLVASDMDWSIAPWILNTSVLAQDFAVIGAHYPHYNATPEAEATGLPLWASEDFSNYNGGSQGSHGAASNSAGDWGAACWVRTLSRNYVNANITAAVMWHITSAMFEQMWWYGASALNAPQPWSGYYEVTNTLWAFSHTTQFTKVGWSYLQHGSGSGWLTNGGSFVSLTDPSRQELTIVVEKMEYATSACEHNPLPYDTSDELATFVLGGSFANITSLYMWYTHYGHADDDPTVIFQYMGQVAVGAGGVVNLTIRVNDVVTLSTVATASKGRHPPPPPKQPFPLPYASNFDADTVPWAPDYWVDQAGVFEVFDSGDPEHNLTIRQQVPTHPIAWAPAPRHRPTGTGTGTTAFRESKDGLTPHTIFGESTWADTNISASFLIEPASSSAPLPTVGAMLGARASKSVNNMQGVWFAVNASGGWNVSFNTATIALPGVQVASGQLPFSVTPGTWHTFSLSVIGKFATGWVDGTIAFAGVDVSSSSRNGFAALGTTDFAHVQFDDVAVNALSNPLGCTSAGPFTPNQNITLWRCDDPGAQAGMAFDFVPVEGANETLWGPPGRFILRSTNVPGGPNPLCLTVQGVGISGWPGVVTAECQVGPPVPVQQQWIVREDSKIQSAVPWGSPDVSDYPYLTADGDFFSIGPQTQLRIGQIGPLSSTLWQWEPVSGAFRSVWLTEQCAAVCTTP